MKSRDTCSEHHWKSIICVLVSVCACACMRVCVCVCVCAWYIIVVHTDLIFMTIVIIAARRLNHLNTSLKITSETNGTLEKGSLGYVIHYRIAVYGQVKYCKSGKFNHSQS